MWLLKIPPYVMLQGLRASLEATMGVKGLLEMMFDVLSGWIDEFISDMEVCGLLAVHAVKEYVSCPPSLPRASCSLQGLRRYHRGVITLQEVEAATDGGCSTPPATRPTTPPGMSPAHGHTPPASLPFPPFMLSNGMRSRLLACRLAVRYALGRYHPCHTLSCWKDFS